MERRLAAIMIADVVGYSGLMEQAEEATAAQLQACQNLISDTVRELGGRVFNRAGDSALAEIDSPINGLRSAVLIQEGLAGQSVSATGGLRMRFGLHLVDIMVSGDDLLGDGVNVAARIQQAAEPGAINISHSLFEQIKRHSPFTFENLGEKRFKNLSEPIGIYRLNGQIKNHRLQSAPTFLATTKAVQPNSVAIMPFTCPAADEDQRYLAEGLTEEIIVELARFKKLHVASRSACFVFADRKVDAAQVARELGVNYVLEGQVRRLGGDIRLSLELTNGQTGINVWADRIVRKFDDLFELMDNVTTQIAATILGRLETDAIEGVRRKTPENMTGYDFMLRGLDLHRVGGVTYDNSRQAVMWFDKAIEADPSYGPAYAWRICAASWLPEFDLAKEKHFIEKALELDANNPEAQRIMGVVKMIYGDFEKARYHHERAMALSPWDAYILARSAAFFSFYGQPKIALKLLEKASELDALLPVWCVEERGIALFASGELELAIQALNELPFQSYRSRLYKCAALMALERVEEAKLAMQQALAINPELSAIAFMRKESWRNAALRIDIRNDLVEAGMPEK
jgi:adenylate cyclase